MGERKSTAYPGPKEYTTVGIITSEYAIITKKALVVNPTHLASVIVSHKNDHECHEITGVIALNKCKYNCPKSTLLEAFSSDR